MKNLKEKMKMINEEFIGNTSTIIKILILTFAPAALLEYVDANTLSVVLSGIIMFIFSIIDAKYANTFAILKNKPTPKDNDVLDDQIAEEGV